MKSNAAGLGAPLDVDHERHDGDTDEKQPRSYCPEAVRSGMGDDGVGVAGGGGFVHWVRSCQAQ